MEPNNDSQLLTNSDYESLLDVLKAENIAYGSPLQIEQNFPYDDSAMRPLEQQTGIVSLPPPLEQYGPSQVESRRESVQSIVSPEPSSTSLSPTSTIPSRDIYLGALGFEIWLPATTSGKRSWLFSDKLTKVFIDINKSLLVQFHVKNFVGGLYVRALPVYQQDDFVSDPVQRCTLHVINDDPHQRAHPAEEPGVCYCKRNFLVRHVLLCSNSQAQYDYDSESDRHSVVVPLEAPQPGSDAATVEYLFTCKTSCPRGMNRRPIIVIFTLENDKCEVLGRQILPVKICSCPKRDKEKEEADADLYGANNGPVKHRMSSADIQEAKRIKTENDLKQENDEVAKGNELQEASITSYEFKQFEEKVFEKLDQIALKQSQLQEKLNQIELKQNQFEEKFKQMALKQNK